jgi:hypothetical protein
MWGSNSICKDDEVSAMRGLDMRTDLAKLVAIGVVSAVCGLSSSAGAGTVLKAITYAPLSKIEDSMVIFKKWVDRVNNERQGELRVELLGGPEVFPVSDQINALSKGLVDVVILSRSTRRWFRKSIHQACPISRRPKSGATAISICSTRHTRKST